MDQISRDNGNLSVKPGARNTLAIMQPYFFPYLGYFQLIAAAERGVIFDTAQYGRKTWMNRNRVLDGRGGWQYVNVPVSSSLGMSIQETTVIDPESALRRIIGQLNHYRGNAPFFTSVIDLVRHTFHASTVGSLGDLNTRSLQFTCDYLGLPFNWTPISKMTLDLPPIDHAGRWALEISSALDARHYINAPGGREIFTPEEWQERDIELLFLDPVTFVYDTPPHSFVENLSILDVLMWNAPETVLGFIREKTRLVG
jgi:hypothetical protein